MCVHNDLLEWLTELRKTVCLLDYGFIAKGYNSGKRRMEELHRGRYTERGAEPP